MSNKTHIIHDNSSRNTLKMFHILKGIFKIALERIFKRLFNGMTYGTDNDNKYDLKQ